MGPKQPLVFCKDGQSVTVPTALRVVALLATERGDSALQAVRAGLKRGETKVSPTLELSERGLSVQLKVAFLVLVRTRWE